MTREKALEWFKDRKKMNLDDKCQQAEDMAIKALEQESCENCISRQAVIDMTGLSEWFDSSDSYNEFVIALSGLPSVTPQPKSEYWRPIKTRPLTEKEKEYFVTDAEFIYECDLPDDGEMVLITDKWENVETDVFRRDDGCYFEDNCGEDDVVAWMPLPESYKSESEEV